MRTLCLLFGLFTAVSLAHANDFYVDRASGDDQANDGSAERPFKTIQKGCNAAVDWRGDVVYVNAGTYEETTYFTKLGTRLVGVGDVVIRGRALGMYVSGGNQGAMNSTVENFTIRACDSAMDLSVARALTIRKCRFQECRYGVTSGNVFASVVFDRCEFSANNSLALQLLGEQITVDRCTFSDNATALNIAASSVLIRNSIFAFNTVGIYRAGGANISLRYNDVVSNGTDYSGISAGATDVSVDPQFRDRPRGDLTLQAGSPLETLGRDIDDYPVPIGAWGVADGGKAPFDGWIDDAGRPLGDPACKFVLEEGLVRLREGVASANFVSPVFQLGPGASLASVSFRARVDDSRGTGSQRVIDADAATFQREGEYRTSPEPFEAGNSTIEWKKFTSRQDLNAEGSNAQVRLLFTTQGR